MLSSFSLSTATLSIQGNIFFFSPKPKFKTAVLGPENLACFFKINKKQMVGLDSTRDRFKMNFCKCVKILNKWFG